MAAAMPLMLAAIARQLGHLLVGVMFLTRLPVPVALDHCEGRLARAAPWFPVVGVIVGAIAGGTLLAAATVLPLPLAAGFAIAAGVLVTGALHEDGLADCCDGLGGGRDREHALQIMRDSRIGTFAGIGLFFSLALRWAALAALTPAAGALALVVAHGVSRGMLPPVLATTGYAREHGAATAVSGGVSAGGTAVALLLSLAVALLAGPVCGPLAFAAAGLVAAAMVAVLVRRLGGYTGDGLGAVQQLAEIAVLASLAGCWR
jgi:adenosylcobinamide-GDP ribazoletransferase